MYVQPYFYKNMKALDLGKIKNMEEFLSFAKNIKDLVFLISK